jgi:hypothetical protein
LAWNQHRQFGGGRRQPFLPTNEGDRTRGQRLWQAVEARRHENEEGGLLPPEQSERLRDISFCQPGCGQCLIKSKFQVQNLVRLSLDAIGRASYLDADPELGSIQ